MPHKISVGDRFQKGDWTFCIERISGDPKCYAYFRCTEANGISGWLNRSVIDAITTWIKPTVTREEIINEIRQLVKDNDWCQECGVYRKILPLFDKLDSMIAPE